MVLEAVPEKRGHRRQKTFDDNKWSKALTTTVDAAAVYSSVSSALMPEATDGGCDVAGGPHG